MTNDLTELNALRVATGKAPLKRWAESRMKMVETIARLRNDAAMTKARATKEATKPTTPAPATIITKKGTFTAVELAKELGWSDRVMRQKLRRIYKGDVSELPALVDDEWKWPIKSKGAVVELLKQDRRKK